MTNTRPKVLIVDDKPENLYVLERLLSTLDVEVIKAFSGSQALNLTLEHDFCVAIVDIQMPEMDGYELVELLRSNKDTAALPVIFVSAIYSDDYHHRKAYEAGAVDFMSKPFVPEILLSKVKVFIDLYQQRQALQKNNLTLAKRAIQLETSHQVGQQITSILDPEELLSQIVKSIQAEFGYYCVSVWLVDDAHPDRLILQASGGRDSSQPIAAGYILPLNAAPSITAAVARSGQHYLANDTSADPNYMAVKELTQTRAELALPLRFGQKVMGVLDIQSDRLAAFEPEDLTALQTLANQIAIAIRNAQLYRQVTHFNEQLEQKVRERTAELQQAYQVLDQLDKTKSDFIEIAAHELRTPLTVIKGYAQILEDQLELKTAEVEDTLQHIIRGVVRLSDIVNSMLDVARIDADTLRPCKEPVALIEVARVVQNEFEAALQERRQTLSLTGLADLPMIDADPDLMYKVFYHLIINAIKYTPDGGSISISGHTVETNGQPVVHITFHDTGIGIDPAYHETIFSKFYQTGQVSFHSSGKTKFKGGGPGLGLAIVKGIVQAHGGKIWVESPGYDEQKCPGSTFHVLLPVSQVRPGL